MYDYNLIARGGVYAEAERRRYRAECMVRCLESSLDRTLPQDFDNIMRDLEAAHDELYKAAMATLDLRWKAANLINEREASSVS